MTHLLDLQLDRRLKQSLNRYCRQLGIKDLMHMTFEPRMSRLNGVELSASHLERVLVV